MGNPAKGSVGRSCLLCATAGVEDCDGCAQLVGGREHHLAVPVWESFSDQQLLAHLPSTSVDAHEVGADSRLWVRELRRRGVTWSRIAETLQGATKASMSGMAPGWGG